MAQKQTSDGSRSIAQASTHPETRVVTPAKWAVGRWFDRFMKVTKPVAQISTPIIIAVVGSWYNCATAKQHDYQAAVQILNQREQSELQARGAVFEKPIAALVDKSNSIDKRILLLETFLYNFHGVINARNLLTDLETEVEGSNNVPQSKRLQLIAQGVRQAQKQMLDAAMHNSHITVNCANMENSEAGPTFGLQVKAKPVICSIKYPGGWLHGDDVHQVSISLLCVGTHDQLESDCPKEGVQATVFSTSGRIEMTIDSKRRDPFELTKFGSPFSDNTVLDHGHRISLLLRSVLPDDTAKPGVEPRANAQLEMVAFPEDLVPPGYQPTITNISRLLGGESG